MLWNYFAFNLNGLTFLSPQMENWYVDRCVRPRNLCGVSVFVWGFRPGRSLYLCLCNSAVRPLRTGPLYLDLLSSENVLTSLSRIIEKEHDKNNLRCSERSHTDLHVLPSHLAMAGRGTWLVCCTFISLNNDTQPWLDLRITRGAF